MTAAIPSLKRLTISSQGQLESWLAKHSGGAQSVMLVTHANASHPDYVGREHVAEALAVHGWQAGRRYTLNADLLGHVITKPAA